MLFFGNGAWFTMFQPFLRPKNKNAGRYGRVRPASKPVWQVLESCDGIKFNKKAFKSSDATEPFHPPILNVILRTIMLVFDSDY